MEILHIDLKLAGSNRVEFRYFWDNPNDVRTYSRSLTELEERRKKVDTDYYTRLPEDYVLTGRALYNWLDGNERILQGEINRHKHSEIILAISTSEGLAHQPWEILHDGKCFLLEKIPTIIPIRWVSDSQPIAITNSPQNRPLNMLFMSTSPLGIEPILDYEAEEGQILAATQRTPVDLRVEESGCLTELGYVVREYERGYFDVFHLTGHATHQDGKAWFLTEDEYGNRVDSSTAEIYEALKSSLPSFIFLSGCRTGYASDGAVTSMAEELLNLGATAVLGWGERVRDTDATAAASKLYWHLSQGETVIEALSSTYQTLIRQEAQDWHKLRLYVGNTLPQALVTPVRTKGRKRLSKPTTTIEFRDDEKRLRVVRREDFVGRRRQLQNCLRTLKTDHEKVGVLIHGMGGWGKSSIASRLWDRLPEYEKVLWWQQIDEVYLLKKLKNKLINPQTREFITDLENSQIELKSRLAYLFSQLDELGEKPFLFILDDFEFNLEPREGGYILKDKVAPILEALVSAIQETGTDHRIIITCRYEFNSNLLEFFFLQGLEPFRKAELTKKLNRLEHFSSGKISEAIQERALILADGNPRLLEFLNNDVLGREDVEAKLTELENSPELWKDKIIWKELYQLIDEPLQQVLSHCLVYKIPVPMAALEVVCNSLTNSRQQLQRGKELGLLEISPEVEEENQVYRVPRILSHIISSIQHPVTPEVYSLYRKAHDKLHDLWGNRKNRNEEKWQEIFRLLFANKENPERFRQGFTEMLAVQYNPEADRVLELELRNLKDKLPTENLFTHLEEYLSQEEWRKADEETAWLFYLVMVQQGYKDWHELCREFPSETLNEIDRLWVEYSDGHFGFSIQKRIWESVGGTPDADYKTWEKFGTEVEWYGANHLWREYNSLSFNITQSVQGNLPARLR